MDCAVQHCCTVNHDEGTVTVSFPGDSSAAFALELVHKSNMLCNLLEDGGEETQFAFSAPQGLLRAWLTCARVLTAQAETLASLDGPELAKFLMAADFFVDEGAVEVLCSTLSTRLFPTTPPSRLVHVEGSVFAGCRSTDAEARAKGDAELVLEGLSDDLAVAVLRQGGDLERHLSSLPPSLHSAAIHAAFPALKSHNTLSIDFAEHSVKASTAALNTVAALSAAPSTKKLLLSNIDAVLSANACRREIKPFKVAFKHALASAPGVLSIASLPQPHVLRLIRSDPWANPHMRDLDFQIGGKGANTFPYVAPHIDQLTGLQDLSLDTISDSEQHQLKFANALQRLTNLTGLRLMSDVRPEALAQCLMPLTHLQSLTANMKHPSRILTMKYPSRFLTIPQPFPDHAIESLAGALRCLTSLTTLRFHQTCTHQKRLYFGGDEGERDSEPQLVKRNMLTDAQMHAFTRALKCMPQLADVCLPIVSVTEGTLQLLGALAGSCHCTRLQALPCTCTSFRGGNACYVIHQQKATVHPTQLVEALCRLPHLQHLQWGAAAQAPGSARDNVVVQCTEAMPSCLSCITLDRYADGASKVLLLSAISNVGRSSLKQLSVDHRVLRSCIQHRGAHIPAMNRALNNVLPDSIASAYNLETLCLKEVEMGPDEAASLAASLRTLDHLTQLHLSGAIRRQADSRSLRTAVIGLLHAVASLSTLRNVALESLAPKAVPCTIAVPNLQALSSLTLTSNCSLSCSEKLAWVSCARLQLLQNLRRLHVPSVVPSSMMKDLAAAVADLPMLTYLGLHQSLFSENAVVVTEVLRCGHVPLRHLDLSGASAEDKKISEDGMAAMADLVTCKTTLWHISGSAGIVTSDGALPFPPAVQLL